MALSLSEMFAEGDGRTFEEQRDEVLSLVVQATDLAGKEQYLRRDVHRCREAHDAHEFDSAYESLVEKITRTPIA